MRAVALGLALSSWAAVAWAADPQPDEVEEGPRLYRRECAPCHGGSGHGDGSAAWLFDPPPPDLCAAKLDRRDPKALVRRVLDAADAITPGPQALEASAARTDALVGHLVRLPRVDWARVARGRSVYIDRCERCHGAFGHPAPSPPESAAARPRDLTAAPFRVDDKQLAAMIGHERAGMPRLADRIDDADMSGLVAFVRLLSPGYETYQVSCARCHGDEGIPPPGCNGPTVAFDARYVATHDTQTIRSKIWHMLDDRKSGAMPHFRGVLTETQAYAIVGYLRRLPPD